jgi:hypothetical protein
MVTDSSPDKRVMSYLATNLALEQCSGIRMDEETNNLRRLVTGALVRSSKQPHSPADERHKHKRGDHDKRN